MRGEQPAVVLGNAVGLVAHVDEAEEILEVLPAGIRHRMEAGDLVGLGDGPLGQQLPILAKGDEHDAVEQPLGHFDGLV